MMHLSRVCSWLLVCLPVLLSDVSQASAQQKPNIVFIAVDDLTYKYVGAFGSKVVKTPNIDGLAARGVLFENSVCQGCMCSPSRNSTITARYPHQLGLFKNSDIKMMPQDQWAFPTALQKSNYHTSWIGKSHLLPWTDGYEGSGGEKKTAAMKELLGFDEVWQSAGRHVAFKKAKDQQSRPKWRSGIDSYIDHLHDKNLVDQFLKEGTGPTTFSMDDYLDGFIARKSSKWISDYDKQDPFFLWVNFSGPHGPYNPPQKYLDLYQPDQFESPIEDSGAGVPDVLRPHLWKKNETATAKQRAQYAGMITFMDEQVGLVLDAIEQKGISDQTLVVFYSDHGIMEGDHGLHHKETLYKEVLNASLIVAGPGCEKNTRIKQPVELLDLARTAMDFAGVTDELQAPAFGHTLRPFLNGSPQEYKNGDFKFAVAEIDGAVALVTQRYKYIRTSDKTLLFDLVNDPDELVNIAETETVDHGTTKSWVASTFSKHYMGWKAGKGPFKKPTSKKPTSKKPTSKKPAKSK